MSFNVTNFRSNMIGDGARPNLFEVTMNFPEYATDFSAAGQKLRFMAKAAQLPGSTVGTVPVYYFGRELKFAGSALTIVNGLTYSSPPMYQPCIESWPH